MSIQMKCPNTTCTTVLTVKEEFAGKMIKCPSCGATAMVPAVLATVPAGAAAGAPAAAAAPAPAAPVSAPSPGPTAATPIPPEAAAPAGPKTNFMETVWSLCDKNGLDRKAQLALMAGLAAMLGLLFALLLTRYTEKVVELATGKSRDEWYFWLGSMFGAAIFFLTVVELVFVVVSFAKMHVFLRYSFFSGALWGVLIFMFLCLYMLVTVVSGSESSAYRTEYSVGLGTYLAILATMGIAGSFGFLSYPEVMKLLNKKPQVSI